MPSSRKACRQRLRRRVACDRCCRRRHAWRACSAPAHPVRERRRSNPPPQGVPPRLPAARGIPWWPRLRRPRHPLVALSPSPTASPGGPASFARGIPWWPRLRRPRNPLVALSPSPAEAPTTIRGLPRPRASPPDPGPTAFGLTSIGVRPAPGPGPAAWTLDPPTGGSGPDRFTTLGDVRAPIGSQPSRGRSRCSSRPLCAPGRASRGGTTAPVSPVAP